MDATFVIDESSVATISSKHASEVIDVLLDRVAAAKKRDERVTASRELYSTRTSDDVEFHTVAFGNLLDREVRERLIVFLGRLPMWDDVADWIDINANVDGVPVIGPSIPWIHAGHARGLNGACIPFGNYRRGCLPVEVAGVTRGIWFVTDDAEHVAYFRYLINEHAVDERTFPDYAPHAFPNVKFLSEVWRGLRDLSGPFIEYRALISRHLAILSDHGTWCFINPGPAEGRNESRDADNGAVTNQLIERRFRRLLLDIAPENPNVYKDPKCRAAREREVDGQVLYFEWHTKIERHRNRIYLHPPSGTDQRVIVGVIHLHLPLPGD